MRIMRDRSWLSVLELIFCLTVSGILRDGRPAGCSFTRLLGF